MFAICNLISFEFNFFFYQEWSPDHGAAISYNRSGPQIRVPWNRFSGVLVDKLAFLLFGAFPFGNSSPKVNVAFLRFVILDGHVCEDGDGLVVGHVRVDVVGQAAGNAGDGLLKGLAQIFVNLVTLGEAFAECW